MRKILQFFTLRKSFSGLLVMVVLVGMGEKMAERFLPIYLMALGSGVLAVGFLNGMDNLLSALYSFPGGYLAEKFGEKKALLIFNLLALFGYLIVIIFPYWQAVIVGSVFFLSWTAISLPATMGLVSKIMPANKRAMGVSVHSLVRRIPMALGPILGGFLIDTYGKVLGVRIAFLVAFILGVIAIFAQQKLIPATKVVTKSSSFRSLWQKMSSNLKILLASDILIRFSEQIPYAFLAIWVMNENGISAHKFGYLTAIEMVVALLIYLPIAYLSDKSQKKPYVIITFVFFTLFPLFLMLAKSFFALCIAFIIRGLKEFGEPTRKALIIDLAPENQKAGMFGLYYLLRDVIVSFAAFGGAYLWRISPRVNFLTAFGFGVVGTLLFAFFGKDFGTEKADSPK